MRGRGFALEESIISGIQKNRERYSAATEEVEEEEESGTLVGGAGSPMRCLPLSRTCCLLAHSHFLLMSLAEVES